MVRELDLTLDCIFFSRIAFVQVDYPGDYPQVPRRGGSLDEGERGGLRYAQDDSRGVCHSERSEGPLAHVRVMISDYPLSSPGRT